MPASDERLSDSSFETRPFDKLRSAPQDEVLRFLLTLRSPRSGRLEG